MVLFVWFTAIELHHVWSQSCWVILQCFDDDRKDVLSIAILYRLWDIWGKAVMYAQQLIASQLCRTWITQQSRSVKQDLKALVAYSWADWWSGSLLHCGSHCCIVGVVVAQFDCVTVIKASVQWKGRRCCPSYVRSSHWILRVIWWLYLGLLNVWNQAFSTISVDLQNSPRLLCVPLSYFVSIILDHQPGIN